MRGYLSRALKNARVSGRHGKAANRGKPAGRVLARVFAGWQTGLSGPVIVLQAGTALNYFGAGLVLPFEIIYLHQARGFPTATAGLVLAALMGTATVVTPPSGALLDRFRAKPILITGTLASALGYAGFAFVDRPWQAFACSAVAGAGVGIAGTADQVLSLTLVTTEQRATSIALSRVAGNFGLGSGATVAGFIIASASHLRTFQALYLFDGVTFAVFALVVLAGIPNPGLARAAPAGGRGTGFRAVAHDRLFLILITANIVLVMVGGALFANIPRRQADAPHARSCRDQRAIRRRPRTAASARPLHVALRPLIHGRRGPRPRGRRRAARNLTRRRLVGRRLDGSTDRGRLAATRRPGTRPALADAMSFTASGTGGDVTRRGRVRIPARRR